MAGLGDFAELQVGKGGNFAEGVARGGLLGGIERHLAVGIGLVIIAVAVIGAQGREAVGQGGQGPLGADEDGIDVGIAAEIPVAGSRIEGLGQQRTAARAAGMGR